ncbi:MAG: hypothetical protein V4677_13805 [Bacteroidota bacterium]
MSLEFDIRKQIATLVLVFIGLVTFSQNKNVEVIKIKSEKLSQITGIKELVPSIPKDYEIESTEYNFNDTKISGMIVNGNEIPISITNTGISNKKGNIINLTIKYFKDKKVLTKACRIIIE